MDFSTDPVPTEASLLTSVTDQSPSSAPPSSSSYSPSEHQKVIRHGVGEETKSVQELKPTKQKPQTEEIERKLDRSDEDIFQKKKRELELKYKEFNDEYAQFEKLFPARDQKLLELDESMKREQASYEKKLADLKADVCKSKKTLKEMGEIMKRESAKLQRIWQKKELEIQHEEVTLQLVKYRRYEVLQIKQLGNKELREAFYREYDQGPNYEENLLILKSQVKQLRLEVAAAREDIQKCEKEETWLSERLDAINREIGSNDEAAISAADARFVDFSTEPVPTEASLLTSVTGNSPSAPLSSSANSPSEHQKVIRHGVGEETKEEEKKEGEEEDDQEMEAETEEDSERGVKELKEFQEHLAVEKADLAKKLDVISNVERKTTELVQKFRNDGYLQAGKNILRTDLTQADRLITDPMMATYEKYPNPNPNLTLTLTLKKPSAKS